MAWPEDPRSLTAEEIEAIPEIAAAPSFVNRAGVPDDPLTHPGRIVAALGRFWSRGSRWILSVARSIPVGLAEFSSVSEANNSGHPIFVPEDVEATTHLRAEAYGPGRVLVNGANSASNLAFGMAAAAQPTSGITPHHPCTLLRVNEYFYRGWIHLGGKTWQVVDFASPGLDAEGNIQPYNWNRTVIDEIEDVVISGDAGVSFSGTWSTLNSTDGSTYIGHVARQSTVAGDYIEIEFECPHDGGSIAVGFSGRTNGCFVAATIDGSTDLVNRLPEFGGNRVIDTYTPTDLTHRQRAVVATGLPAKDTPYVLRLTLTTDKNPSAGSGNRFLFNCAFVDQGPLARVRIPRSRPRPWASGDTWAAYEECIGANGWIYVTVAGGTSGATLPAHTSGSSSDGGVTWTRISPVVAGFVTKATEIQGAGSRLEYAYEFTPEGEATANDVGGIPHGNEYLTASSVVVDGTMVSLAVGEHVVGRNISLVQRVHAYWGDVANPTPIADTLLAHNMGGGRIVVEHETTFMVGGVFGYHYPAMWPLLGYAAQHRGNVFEEMETPQAGRVRVFDYPGSDPLVGRTRDFQMRAIGDIYRPRGTDSVPEEGDGEYLCIATLTIDPSSVGYYQRGSTMAAMSTNFASASANVGATSWPIKMYFTRSNAALPETVSAGQRIRAINVYHVGLFPKAVT